MEWWLTIGDVIGYTAISEDYLKVSSSSSTGAPIISATMTKALETATLGYPRIGRNREMKRALEKYWANTVIEAALNAIYETILVDSVTTQADAGVTKVAVGDHTLYDHVLDLTVSLGCIPTRFSDLTPGLPTYFAMARGVDDAPALDMSKFFGTNYHYLVPELDSSTTPSPNFDRFLRQLDLAVEKIGVDRVVPNVLGPVTYIHIARLTDVTPTEILSKILPIYVSLFETLRSRGFKEVQLHEPALVLGEANTLRPLYTSALGALQSAGLPINLVTFFDDIDVEVFPWVCELPGLSAISLYFTRGDNISMFCEFCSIYTTDGSDNHGMWD